MMSSEEDRRKIKCVCGWQGKVGELLEDVVCPECHRYADAYCEVIEVE